MCDAEAYPSVQALSVLKFSEDLRRVVEEPKRRTLAFVAIPVSDRSPVY